MTNKIPEGLKEEIHRFVILWNSGEYTYDTKPSRIDDTAIKLSNLIPYLAQEKAKYEKEIKNLQQEKSKIERDLKYEQEHNQGMLATMQNRNGQIATLKAEISDLKQATHPAQIGMYKKWNDVNTENLTLKAENENLKDKMVNIDNYREGYKQKVKEAIDDIWVEGDSILQSKLKDKIKQKLGIDEK